jgi:hypothetical protein
LARPESIDCRPTVSLVFRLHGHGEGWRGCKSSNSSRRRDCPPPSQRRRAALLPRSHGQDRSAWTTRPGIFAFLDFIVLSDRAREYRCVEPQPKQGVGLLAAPDDVVLAHGWLSGADYDLEAEAKREVAHVPVNRLFVRSWKVTKLVVAQWRERPPAAAFTNRPRGTIVAFRFNSADGGHLLKAFAFS